MIAVELALASTVVVEAVDISASEDLMLRYGVRIPVLQHPDGRELNWPFTPQQVRALFTS